MADPRGFLNTPQREAQPSRPVPVRIMDWKEVHTAQDDTVLRRQAGRCMDCGIPFCHQGCPLGNLIPEWNDLTRRGNYRQAIERLHATNNFPEFTGRLCPAPCETACVLSISQPAVTIKQVEVSIIDRAFDNGLVTVHEPEWLSGKTVAVIGSGPAGLAAAQQLSRAGHTVIVYERDDAVGGLLRYGIPEFKMEKSVIDRRLVQLRGEGIRFRTGVAIGAEGHLSLEDLRSRFDAVVLATGSTVPRDIGAENAKSEGVYPAMEYLVPANRESLGAERGIDAEGKHVVIVGGGDTGADCYGTAIRQGAASVTQLDIRLQPTDERPGHQPWPTYPLIHRVGDSHEEGGERVFGVNTLEVLTNDDGSTRALKIVEGERIDGRFDAYAGTEREIPADLVLIALGFTGPDSVVDPAGLLPRTKRGNFEREDDYAVPGEEGLFVAGDAGRGQSLIVWAIAEGRAAAATVDAYLTGASILPVPVKASDNPITV
ncbi:glutamate synthase subunit beta [Ornithinimicrobium sp. Arc0846-15]|nr:glutamate synthase subunit beta [Ornithinimicrobium laminariae]